MDINFIRDLRPSTRSRHYYHRIQRSDFTSSHTVPYVLETYTESNYGHSITYTAKTAWFQRQTFLLNNYA